MSNELLIIAAIIIIGATIAAIYHGAPRRLRVQLMAAAGLIGAGIAWLVHSLSRKAPPPPEPKPEPTPQPSKEWMAETDRITKEIEDDLQAIARDKSEALKTVDSGVADAGFVDWLDKHE